MQFMKLTFLFVMTLVFSLNGDGMLQAQNAANASHPATSPHTSRRVVGFRQAEWQTRHMHDPAAAEQLITHLKQSGCEVTQHDHDGHIDVRYRCTQWKTISADNADFALQWTSWFLDKGMEIVLPEPPAEAGMKTVRFRIADWHTSRVQDAAMADEFLTMLDMIGCQTDRQDQGTHTEVRFRCPEWRTIGLQNCGHAHKWQDWLKQYGFETEHSH